jgi:hypothetical protein
MSIVVERLHVLGRMDRAGLGRRLLVGHEWDLTVMLDLGNWIAHSLGRQQAWLDAVSISLRKIEL